MCCLLVIESSPVPNNDTLFGAGRIAPGAVLVNGLGT